MSIETHFHITKSLLCHLDLLRLLKTLAKLKQGWIVKFSWLLWRDSFVSTAWWVLLQVWLIGILNITVKVSIASTIGPIAKELNFRVSLNTWSTWNYTHHTSLSGDGLQCLHLLAAIIWNSAYRIALALCTLLGMWGCSGPTQTIRLLLTSNLDLTTIQYCILSSCSNSCLRPIFTIHFFHSQSIRS
jgi:hypothetical protein